MFKKNKKKSEGKKATAKVTIDGIMFDSPIEGEVYNYLKKHKDIEIIQCHYEILIAPREKIVRVNRDFGYNFIGTAKKELKIIPLVYTPDFFIKYRGVKIYVEAKGREYPDFKKRMSRYENSNYIPLLIATSIDGLEKLLGLVDINLEYLKLLEALDLSLPYNHIFEGEYKLKDLLLAEYLKQNQIAKDCYRNERMDLIVKQTNLEFVWHENKRLLEEFCARTVLGHLPKTLLAKIESGKLQPSEIVNTIYKMCEGGFDLVSRNTKLFKKKKK